MTKGGTAMFDMRNEKARVVEIRISKMMTNKGIEFAYVNAINVLYEGIDYTIPNGYVSVLLVPKGNEGAWKIHVGLIGVDKEFKAEIEVALVCNLDRAIEAHGFLLKELIQGVYERTSEPTYTCWHCGNTPKQPVVIPTEPEEIWCLECALKEQWDGFYLPNSQEDKEDLEAAAKEWSVSLTEAYARLEQGKDFRG